MPTARACAGSRPKPPFLRGVGAVAEIVIDGLTLDAVETAMARGLEAAAAAGATKIAAGNYGGKLGQYHIKLRSLLD